MLEKIDLILKVGSKSHDLNVNFKEKTKKTVCENFFFFFFIKKKKK